MNPPQVAIIGSGPAGCYTALALSRACPAAGIVVVDRLPVPYGLVRYGVAADHQGTKAVIAQFDRLFRSGKAHFLGGVQVGDPFSLEAVLDAFDIVVWAGGLARDRQLGIPGETLAGVHGSGEVTRAWNAHPLQPWQQLRIGPRVAIAGAGNVSLDLVRLLAKSARQLAGSDLDEVFFETVPEPVSEITVLVRGEPGDARWDGAMLHELAVIEGAAIEVDAASLAPLAAAAAEGHTASAVLTRLQARPVPERPRLVLRFIFGARITAIVGDTRVAGACIERRGEYEEFPVDTVLTAIGFELESLPEHPRLFRAGWARTGPQGSIPGLRTAARDLAAEIAARLPKVSQRAGLASLAALPTAMTSFADWTQIDAHELSSAPADRCRRKVRDLALLPRIIEQKGSTQP